MNKCIKCGLPPDLCVCDKLEKEKKRMISRGVSILCPDSKPCKIKTVDGFYVCRHGLVLVDLDGTLICPLKLQEEYEKKKWGRFMVWYNDWKRRHPIRRLLDF